MSNTTFSVPAEHAAPVAHRLNAQLGYDFTEKELTDEPYLSNWVEAKDLRKVVLCAAECIYDQTDDQSEMRAAYAVMERNSL